jgi:membrane protein YdbS with pleckstrin-like domain
MVRSAMILLNSWQRLPPRAIWFGVLTSLCVTIVLVGVASLVQLSGSARTLKCTGSMCGSMSGSLVAGFIYLYSIYLVGRSVLYYKTFAFLLTDRTLTTVAGYFHQNSSTFRFDRIQDIDTVRGPIHAILGVKTVAIWTASPDQFVRNKRRPDGRIVLDCDSADWLRDYLSNPPAPSVDPSAGSAVRQSALLKTAPRGNVGLAIALCAAAALAVPVLVFWKDAKVIRPPEAMAPAITAAPAVATPLPRRQPSTPRQQAVRAVQSSPTQQPVPVRVAQSAAPVQAVPDDYAIACAIHGSGDINGVIPCAKFGEAQRCPRETDFPSKPTSEPAVLTVFNRSNEDLKFYWLNPSGTRTLYASLPPGGHVNQQSHIGAHWLVSSKNDRCIAIFDAATTTIGIF